MQVGGVWGVGGGGGYACWWVVRLCGLRGGRRALALPLLARPPPRSNTHAHTVAALQGRRSSPGAWTWLSCGQPLTHPPLMGPPPPPCAAGQEEQPWRVDLAFFWTASARVQLWHGRLLGSFPGATPADLLSLLTASRCRVGVVWCGVVWCGWGALACPPDLLTLLTASRCRVGVWGGVGWDS